MKKILAILLIALLMLSFVACTSGDTGEKDGDVLKIVCLINGTMGDKSFFDSANEGMQWIKDTYGDKVEIKVIEMTYDESKWAPTAADVCAEDWDIIVTGTWQMVETIMELSKQYPDKLFWIYDEAAYYDQAEYPNIYSMMYKQNEGSFLAGMVAGGMTKTNKVAFLGGMDNSVINDFMVGYVEGVKYINPDCEVIVSYIGSFDDSPKGKEISLSFYNQGVDVIFSCAGQAGLGAFDAAVEKSNVYVIGVDGDQAMMFKDTEPNKAALTLTSMYKLVNQSFLYAMQAHFDDTLPYGSVEHLGIAEGCVGVADNEYYQQLVPEDLRTKVAQAQMDILSGAIVVSSALNMEIAVLDTYR